ncbi:MAG: Nramp family divalent metal transporter [Parvularculaceae bacterium]
MKRRFGPGALVAAAFVGPGTVTTCTLAGATYGYALAWTLALATAATIVLHDMAARLGVGARLGLGEAMIRLGRGRASRWALGGLAFAGLAVGNSAYEAGNLVGGALGVEAVLGDRAPAREATVCLLALVAGGALATGRYRVLERALVALVGLMAFAFVTSAIIVRPDLGALAAGFTPRVPDGAWTTAVALVGTTIVPYNLFLHAAASRRKWDAGDASALRAARVDSGLAIGLGGLVSILILSAAAASLFSAGLAVESAVDMARAVEPAFGPAARAIVGVGLFAAGLTSAITAPMATGFAVGELLGGDAARRARIFRIAALGVLTVGVGVSLADVRPVSLILIAQYANGLLLPLIAGLLLMVMNDEKLLGERTNGLASNAAGALAVGGAAFLGARATLRAAGLVP